MEFSEDIRKKSAAGQVSTIASNTSDGNLLLELKQSVRNTNGSVTNSTVLATGFTYSSSTHVATWTFPNLADGKYALHLKAAGPSIAGIVDVGGNALDADWTNDSAGTPDVYQDDPSKTFTLNLGDGNVGTTGNEFRFHFALLAGDFDGDGIVEADTNGNHDDLDAVGDFNGDGTVNSTDSTLTAQQDDNSLPFRPIGSADLNDDEMVDGLDLAVWQSGYGGSMVGDVDGDGIVGGLDFLLWQVAYETYSVWGDPPSGGSFAAEFAATLGMTLADLTDGLPPQVASVIISGSQSVHDPFSFDTVDGSGMQLATVPVGLADTISVVFSENVNIAATSLIVVGMTTANVPEQAEFTYDQATYTATWRYEGWSLGDNYLLYLQDSITDVDGNFLDGEWTNPASRTTNNALVSEFPSGDGTSGGNFIFAMTLLPGDANLDNVVNMSDWSIVSANLPPSMVQKLFTQGDFNGDGVVNGVDSGIVFAGYYAGVDLQNPFLLADLDQDGDVDADDLDQLSSNYGMLNPTGADGDLNGDNVIDDDDLDLAFAQYGLAFTNFVA